MSGSDDFASGSRDLLAWRRRARQWTAAGHAVGLLLGGVLMLTTEAPAARLEPGASNVTAA